MALSRPEPARGSFSNRYTRRALVTLASVAVLVMYAEMMLVTALPSIEREFAVTPAQASWVLTIYMLVGACATPLLGKLGDLHGKRRILLLVMAGYAAAVTAAGFAPTFGALLALRAVQGLGLAMFPLAFGLIRDEFPRERMAIAQGIVSAMFGVGAALGIVGGSAITEAHDWRTTYHTVTPLAVALAAMIGLTIRESPVRASGRLDVGGALLLGTGLASLLVAVTQGSEWGWRSPPVAGLAALGVLLLATYVVAERRVADPMMPLPLLASRNLVVANVAILLNAYAIITVNQAVAFLVQSPPPVGFGATVLESGLIQVPASLAVLLVSPLAGLAVARAGPRRPMAAGLLASTVALLLLAFVHGSRLQVASAVVLVGLGTAFVNVAVVNQVVLSTPPAFTGVSTGVNGLFRLVGGVVAPVVAGAWMTAYTPPGAFFPASDHAYLAIFTTAAAATLAAALVARLARPIPGAPRAEASPGLPPPRSSPPEPATNR